jgi:hypothetical protein
MSTNRRDFLKNSFIGAGLLSTGLVSCTNLSNKSGKSSVAGKHTQRFNMCGYAAPKLDKVRVGFIGLG